MNKDKTAVDALIRLGEFHEEPVNVKSEINLVNMVTRIYPNSPSINKEEVTGDLENCLYKYPAMKTSNRPQLGWSLPLHLYTKDKNFKDSDWYCYINDDKGLTHKGKVYATMVDNELTMNLHSDKYSKQEDTLTELELKRIVKANTVNLIDPLCYDTDDSSTEALVKPIFKLFELHYKNFNRLDTQTKYNVRKDLYEMITIKGNSINHGRLLILMQTLSKLMDLEHSDNLYNVYITPNDL